MFDGDLPAGNRAQEHFIARFAVSLPGLFRQFFRLGGNPQERARVEQYSHGSSPPKRASMSAGSGSKNSAGTTNFPSSMPSGLLVSLRGGNGRISAIGTFLLQR